MHTVLIYFIFINSCMVYMLREMLDRQLLMRSQMLQYIGERFRFKLDLPPWYTHEQVGEFLLS